MKHSNPPVEKMNVVIDAHGVGVRYGGNEQYFENIIAGLAGLPGEKPNYFALNYRCRGAGKLSHMGVKPVELRSSSTAIQRAAEIPFLCRKLNADVLHVPFNFLPVGKYKKIISIHDLAFIHVEETFNRLERIRMKALTSWAAKKADHILTISEFSRQDIIRTYGVLPSKVTVAYPSVDGSVFRSWNSKQKLGFCREQSLEFPYFLFVGTLQPRKNINFMIEAFKIFVSSPGNESKLILVGRKGWKFQEIFNYIDESGISDRIMIKEDVSPDDLAGFYNSAEALIMPSIFEGFGIPIIEAMSCGCPVLSSNSSCLPEIYGDAAISFSPNEQSELVDALCMFSSQASVRQSLIIKGTQNAARFSWQNTAAIIRDVYLNS